MRGRVSGAASAPRFGHPEIAAEAKRIVTTWSDTDRLELMVGLATRFLRAYPEASIEERYLRVREVLAPLWGRPCGEGMLAVLTLLLLIQDGQREYARREAKR